MAFYRISEASRRVVDETKRLYADLLSKPLDDRQLARPTFKFIQEVTKNLITETKTLRNVFNPSDFETENKVWDKRRKCDFVQRLIDFSANHKQPVVGCVADKLVAGLEPNKTNELLQSLARIAHARLSGQDGNSNRPRTFTKRSTSSASSSKQQTEDARNSSRNPQPVTGTHAPPLRPTINKSSAQRDFNETKMRTSLRKVIPPTRDVSASSSRNGSGDVRASVQLSGNSSHRSKNPSVIAINDRQTDNNGIGLAEEPREAPSQTTIPITETPAQVHSMKQSMSKSASSSVGAAVQSSHDIIVSESDISKNIQQLQSSLDQLRSNLLELSQFDIKLKAKLLEYIES